MKVEKFKVLLYLKRSGLDKSGKAPIMGRITVNRTIAQFSSKLSCNPKLWNPRCVIHPALFPEPLSPRLCLLRRPLSRHSPACVKPAGPPCVLICNFPGSISLTTAAAGPWPQPLHRRPENCPYFIEEVAEA